MKILLLSHTGAVTGGAEKCLLEYVDALRGQSYTCKVIVPYKGPMTDAFSKKGVDCTVIGYGWATNPHRSVNTHKIMASTGNSLVKIFQEVEKYKPDIIITNTSVIPWGLYAGKAFDIPTVLLVHEILNEKDPSLRMAPNYAEYREILNRNADYVIYNSQFVKNEFASDIKLPQISKDILYPLPPLDKSKIDSLFKENLIGNNLRVAIFGALSPRKNQLEAVEAVRILNDRGINNITLDLYGDTSADPSYTKSLRRFIREHSLTAQVKIKGFAANVYEKMNEYNVILSTATYEPFGRTLIEGQLFGKIVVTNNTGGGNELVNDLSTGLVYRSGSPELLADKIVWILNNPESALALGTQAKREQLKKYITSSRYKALFSAVEYFAKNKNTPKDVNLFEPMMSLFQYNHQLNNRYKHLYKLTHNRLTRPIKNVLVRSINTAKIIIKRFI